jgi:hypothetical protein
METVLEADTVVRMRANQVFRYPIAVSAPDMLALIPIARAHRTPDDWVQGTTIGCRLHYADTNTVDKVANLKMCATCMADMAQVATALGIGARWARSVTEDVDAPCCK